jgi:hypothetical protein
MAAYTLTAATGSFGETGRAAQANYGLPAGPGVFNLNPPRNVLMISLPPAIGTNLFWNNAAGAYYVVLQNP